MFASLKDSSCSLLIISSVDSSEILTNQSTGNDTFQGIE